MKTFTTPQNLVKEAKLIIKPVFHFDDQFLSKKAKYLNVFCEKGNYSVTLTDMIFDSAVNIPTKEINASTWKETCTKIGDAIRRFVLKPYKVQVYAGPASSSPLAEFYGKTEKSAIAAAKRIWPDYEIKCNVMRECGEYERL